MSKDDSTTLTEDELKKVEEVTEDDRDTVIKKEWKQHYDEQLEILVNHVKKVSGLDKLDKKIMKKLKKTAETCAKNRAIMDKKYGPAKAKK